MIIGYCAGTYIREKMFLDEKRAVKEHRLEGGINSSASASNKEIRRRSKYVAIALFSWLRNDYRNMLNRLLYALKYSKYRRAPGDKRLYEKYAPEIIETEKKETDPSDVEDSLEYKKALNAFLNIKKMADKIQAKVFFVYLPQRGDIYYEKLTGKKLPKRSFVLIESGLLRKFCDKEGIIFIDPSKRIIYYVNNLKNGELMSSYPYLEIDGHMSPCGNRLVAKEILTYLDSSAKPIK